MLDFERFRIDPDAWNDFCREARTKRAQEAYRRLAEQMDAACEENLHDMAYGEFLETAYWRTLRTYLIDCAAYQCQNCSRSNRFHTLQVHHLTYEHRGSEWRHLEDLVVLCERCHQQQH